MATVRSLWRWFAWRLAQGESTIDWTDACVWDIEADNNILDVEPDNSILEIEPENNILDIEPCSEASDNPC